MGSQESVVANQPHTSTLEVTLSLSSAGVYKCRATYPSQEVAEEPLSGGVVNSGEAEIVVFGQFLFLIVENLLLVHKHGRLWQSFQ